MPRFERSPSGPDTSGARAARGTRTATATIPEVPTAIAAATPPAVTAVSTSTKHLEEPLLLLQ